MRGPGYRIQTDKYDILYAWLFWRKLDCVLFLSTKSLSEMNILLYRFKLTTASFRMMSHIRNCQISIGMQVYIPRAHLVER